MAANSYGGTDLTVSVTGAKQAMNDLRKFDQEAYWKSLDKIKAAAGGIVASIDGNFPGVPPRGFQHNGRTGWSQRKPTEVQYGGRQPKRWKRDQVWPLLRVKVVDAPRMIFDMAGAKTRGNPLDVNLSGNYGPASRAVWRVSEQTRRTANKAITDAMREVVASTNRKLSVIRSAA